MLTSDLHQFIANREKRLIAISLGWMDVTEALLQPTGSKEFPFLRTPITFPITVDHLIRLMDSPALGSQAFHILKGSSTIEQRLELGRKLCATQDENVYIVAAGFYDDVPNDLWPSDWPVWGPFGYNITFIDFDNQVPAPDFLKA